jgi:NodT family efflux transporter outer membrane factor (OMF) lipoprotein
LVVVAMLMGCAVGPDFQSPDAPGVAGFLPGRATPVTATAEGVPTQVASYGHDIPGRWWELLHSRHLNMLIEDGIIRNAELEAAEAAVRVAQANALVARGGLFPTAVASFDSSRQKTPSAALATNAASGANLYSLHTAQLTVSYVPDVFGGTRRLIETADAMVDVQAFQREGTYLTLTANIALAAIQEASLRGQIAATRRIITLQTQLLGILRQQNERGQIALPDVLSQETALAQAKLLLPPLEKQLAQQRDLLAYLSGRFPSEEIAASFELRVFQLPRRLPLTIPAEFVRQRPDVRVAEAMLHAANAQIGVAIANRFPQITLNGNVGSTATSLAQLFTPGTGFWTLAGNVAQTVFDANQLANKQRAAEESMSQTAALYRNVVLTAFQNVADTLRALQSDARAVSAANAAERAAARNIDVIRRQVEQGQVSIPTLINAQQAYLQTSLAAVQARAQRLADTVALFQALGGGWWNRLEPAVVDRALPEGVNETFQ